MKDFHPYPRVLSILNLRWLMQTRESILVIVDGSILEFGVPDMRASQAEEIWGRRVCATARRWSRRAAAALFLPRRRAKVPRRTALLRGQ